MMMMVMMVMPTKKNILFNQLQSIRIYIVYFNTCAFVSDDLPILHFDYRSFARKHRTKYLHRIATVCFLGMQSIFIILVFGICELISIVEYLNRNSLIVYLH